MRAQTDINRMPVSGPNLRYVQQTSTDDDPYQPVKVKYLKWDGSAFVTYGDEFRIGDATTIVGAGDKFWIAWRTDGLRWMPVGGADEKYRLIRGQSYGAQSGGTILIDNVVPLANGVDPVDGDSTTQVSVANIFGQTYADNEIVDAIHNGTGWETLKTTGGVNNFRLIRGKATGAVAAEDDTFSIDGIILLAGSDDPRSTPGDMAETLFVAKTQKEILQEDEDVTAIYSPGIGDGVDWELLVVERYRAIRGLIAYGHGSDDPLLIDTVYALDNGLDPRSDPTDDSETVEVKKIVESDAYSDSDLVIADWNAKLNRWEARPKSAAGKAILTALPDAEIDAGDSETLSSGTGSVRSVGAGGSTSLVTDSATLWNPFEFPVSTSCTVQLISGTDYLIVGADKKLTCTTTTVVTNVECVDDELQITTDAIQYVSAPCP